MMITRAKNWYGLLWLTSFLVTGGVSTYLGDHAFAQNAGTLTVNSDRLIVRDDTSIFDSSSGGSLNLGGNLTIRANDLVLTNLGGIVTSGDGASISALSSGSGSGGNITITVKDIVLIPSGGILTIRDGARLIADNIGSGSAGNITINTGNPVVLDGISISVNPSLMPSNGDSSGDSLNLGGYIFINTETLIIRLVPEPSFTLGLLAFVVVGATSISKFKQRSR